MFPVHHHVPLLSYLLCLPSFLLSPLVGSPLSSLHSSALVASPTQPQLKIPTIIFSVVILIPCCVVLFLK